MTGHAQINFFRHFKIYRYVHQYYVITEKEKLTQQVQ